MYHVMSRGNRRTVLFKEKADYLRFLECVEKARKILGFQVHALCLMTNHFHMTIETADTELWKIMQRILHPYSMDFNHKYHFTGHLFESRYTACIIEDDRYFLEVSRYIHSTAAMGCLPGMRGWMIAVWFSKQLVILSIRPGRSPAFATIPGNSTACLWKARYPTQSSSC